MGTEEQAAVTITGVSQAAFPDHNVQYQFRTENNGGQVSLRNLLFVPLIILCHMYRNTSKIVQSLSMRIHNGRGRTGLEGGRGRGGGRRREEGKTLKLCS